MGFDLILAGETKELSLGSGTIVIKRLDRADWHRMQAILVGLQDEIDAIVAPSDADEDAASLLRGRVIAANWGLICKALALSVVSIDGKTDDIEATLRRIRDDGVIGALRREVSLFNETDGPEGNSPSSQDGISGANPNPTAGTANIETVSGEDL